MSFLLRIFQKAEEDDETVLSALASDIQKRQTKLDEIRLRERRTTLAVSLWSFVAWSVYSAVWYSGFRNKSWRTKSQKAIFTAPVIVGPIFILFVRRIVQLWFNSKGNAEEKTLRELRKKQHTKVEEIKKKTNYYSTRDLLQKYDPSSPSNSPQRQPIPIVNPQKLLASPKPSPASGESQKPGIQVPPAGPVQTKRYWYDRLADVVLGEDGNADDTSRYALICEKCFAHNGLVKESVWEETQYVCPKCQHFNGPKKSKSGSEPPTPSMMHSPASAVSPEVRNHKSESDGQKAPTTTDSMDIDS